MATTPNYGWVMPDPTDFVTDLPADFEIFGDAVDTTVDAIDDRVTDLEVITTEGDLIVGDASGDPSRLALGTSGQVLSSNGTTTTWITPGTSVPPYIVPTGKTLYQRSLPFVPATSGAAAPTEDVTHYTPLYLPTCTIDRIAIRTGNTVSGTNTTRLGIYNSGTDGLPNTVLIDAGTVNPTATGTTYEITISQAVTAGWYFLAINRQASGATPANFISANPSSAGTTQNNSITFFTAPVDTTARITGYTESSVTGAFATAGTLITATSSIPIVWVRVA
jgi:hypothetical protein